MRNKYGEHSFNFCFNHSGQQHLFIETQTARKSHGCDPLKHLALLTCLLLWYRLTPKVTPQSILSSEVRVNLLSSTAVQTIEQIWIFYCPGVTSGPSDVLHWPVQVQDSKLNTTVIHCYFILKGHVESRMISISIHFFSIKPPFSQQKATIGTLKTPISRYNAVFVMTAAHCQDELWGEKHAHWGFSARVECEEAIFFIDSGSANCSVMTFLWAVLHPMYISEVKHNETLNGNHFHTTGSYITENKKLALQSP